jgi:hypothetical protein
MASRTVGSSVARASRTIRTNSSSLAARRRTSSNMTARTTLWVRASSPSSAQARLERERPLLVILRLGDW